MYMIKYVKKIALRLSSAYYDPLQQEQVAWWMLEAITSKSKAQLVSSTEELTVQQEEMINNWIKKHVDEAMPLAYLIGTIPFAHLQISIEPPLLIPRSETEEWICNLIQRMRTLVNQKLTILDLCTGSGVIALALAKAFPQATVYATDISEQALVVAEKNAKLNGITTITFLKSDLFENLENKKFDFIVANPPYISHEEWLHLDPSVRIWEDYKALVALDNGLALIKKIIDCAPYFLNKNSFVYPFGQLYIEIGNQQAGLVQNYMEKRFKRVDVLKDYNGNDRVVVGYFVLE